jgi:hypothetical protein
MLHEEENWLLVLVKGFILQFQFPRVGERW